MARFRQQGGGGGGGSSATGLAKAEPISGGGSASGVT